MPADSPDSRIDVCCHQGAHAPKGEGHEPFRPPRPLESYTRSLAQAVRGEMQSMQAELGPYEIPLANPSPQEGPAEEGHWYNFAIVVPSDKLALNMECTLRQENGECLVQITALEQRRLTLRADGEIALDAQSYALVVYPWFLFEKLLAALEALEQDSSFHPRQALALFGGAPPQALDARPLLPAGGLNDSQQAAVALCLSRSPAYVWGPPGTGKTATLAHLLDELLHQDLRVLLTSTTNAAIDQALDQYAARPQSAARLQTGQVLRLGYTPDPVEGTRLEDVVDASQQRGQHAVERLEERRLHLRQAVQSLERLVEALDRARDNQMDLFGGPAAPPPVGLIQQAFAGPLANAFQGWPPEQAAAFAQKRLARLQRALALNGERLGAWRRRRADLEARAVSQTRLVVATLSNVYLSRHLEGERFDAVVVEEAGMAVLPTLFYCAGLSRQRVILVGDPKQLPPIVHSRSPQVRRAMARSIFALSPAQKEGATIMLATQYRMHPAIGDLVSRTFYDGRLRHGDSTRQREETARRQPFAGHPLVVCDTAGTTRAAHSGSGYSRANEKAAALGVDLVRRALADGLDDIGVIAPYVEQARLYRSLLPEVECHTVHRFQGHEKDMILFDATDAAPLAPGVLLVGGGGSEAAALLNVSLSRARAKLVILADVAFFEAQAPNSLIQRLLADARVAGHYHRYG